MANTCKTCRRDDIDEINDLLAKEVPLRNIVGTRKNITTTALHRHKNTCLVELFAEIRHVKREGLLAKVDAVESEIEAVKAEFGDNPTVRVGLIGKMLDAIEKEAKLTGAYIKDAPNPADNLTIARQVVEGAVAKGFDRDEAIRRAAADYGVLETELIG